MAELQLVTGAAGFLGQALVKRLAAAGLPVRCLVRPGADASRLALPGVEIFRSDLLDPAKDEAALAGAARVWHLAALVRPGGFLVSRRALLARFKAVNEDLPARLAAAAARAGVKRFIHFSTISALGPGEDLRDDALPAPLTYYGKSKLAGERLFRAAAERLGLNSLVLRPCMIYGPGAAGWAPLFDAAARRKVLVPGAAANKFSICYLENFLDGALLAADKAPSGAALNVSEGSLSLRNLLLTLGAALGRQPRLVGLPIAALRAVSAALDGALGLAGLYLPGAMAADPARLLEACSSWSHRCEGLRALGWKPAVSTADGLAASLGAKL
jgi:dihydroflavonol-4-reductase